MNNYEKIKQLSFDDMAEFITKNAHKVGKLYGKDLPKLDVLVYKQSVKQWLLQGEETMKVKDLIEIIEQNEDFKTRIKIYKSRPETQNIGEVLEHNYKQWLESEVE